MQIDYAARAEKQRQRQESARVKHLEKVSSPEYREAAQEKARQRFAKSVLNRQSKLADPAYRQSQLAKQKESQARRLERAKALREKPKAKASKPAAPRQRIKTTHERKLWDELGQLPCVACLMHGKEKHPVSIHHMRGRTTVDCHRYVIPLCEWHHDVPAPAEVRREFQWLIPRHAKGSVGGKAAFEAENATEAELMQCAYQLVGRHDEVALLLAL